MDKNGNAVAKYARMWPREIFDCHILDGGRKRPLAKSLEFLNRPGVYVLYREDVPYYIGQATKLRHRLWHHANLPGKVYFNFWNFFSAFVVENQKQRDEIEGILIAAMPTANSAKPKLKREAFPKEVIKLVRRIRRNKAESN